ncbi:SDR family NAD(P)-dependent oxidoreductase [Maritalea sp.]|uniref:SDR family NAD(P)-dependent oxidoreductase n=1 Tax=Maritalea sp. TaxID=2003361 RepID=UPI003EF27241
MDNQNKNRRHVWITGASSGIGYALAERMAKSGDKVAISARSKDKLAELVNKASNIDAFPLDVTRQEDVGETIGAIEQSGPIDLAVLNAGAWSLMDAVDMDVKKVRQGVEVNYMGVIYALRKLLPLMKARGQGHIAIVASVAGYRGLPRSVAYGPTKAALINLAETLKPELEQYGITVSVINPGFVDTDMTRDNPFPMPDLITPDKAAIEIEKGLNAGRFEIRFPWRFTTMMKLMRILPNGVFFWAMKRIMA